MTARDRLYEKKFEWHRAAHARLPTKRIARFFEGHVYIGTASMHLADSSRRIRCIQRLKIWRVS